MNRFWQNLYLILFASFTLSGCEMYKGTFLEGATDLKASGKMLAVHAEPESLGHKRLRYHSLVYSGLKVLLQMKGDPDYIVEETGFTKRRVVMFYLKKNEAYLMELDTTLVGPQSKLRGPEPIGKKTRELLDALTRLEKAKAAIGEDSGHKA